MAVNDKVQSFHFAASETKWDFVDKVYPLADLVEPDSYPVQPGVINRIKPLIVLYIWRKSFG